jgi:hypothetical protein
MAIAMLGDAAVSSERLPPFKGHDSRAEEAQAEEPKSYNWVCRVEEKLAKGNIRAVRAYKDDGKIDYGDYVYWTAAGYSPAKSREPVEWKIDYIWNRTEQYNDRLAELKFHFQLESGSPEVALLSFQRPFPVKPGGIIEDTALSTVIFKRPSRDYYGDVPLGDLLAYAGPFDELEWKVTKPHNQYGGTEVIVSGKLDVAAFKEASAAITSIKGGLDKFGANFRSNCKYEESIGIVVY